MKKGYTPGGNKFEVLVLYCLLTWLRATGTGKISTTILVKA